MFRGVNHVGIGVSDMEKSIKFYGDRLGFKEVMFDYTGPIQGMEKITGNPETRARVVMLKNQNVGPLGLGMIKLVRLLPPDKPEAIPAGTCWGEIGIAEVCINVHMGEEVFRELVQEKGCKPLLPLDFGPLPPYDTTVGFCYIADPDGGKIELIEWRDMCPGLGTTPKIEGVNHVAFGVSNMENSLNFYSELGFTELFFDFKGVLDAMNVWFPEPVEQHIVMMTNYYGAGIEPSQHFPPSKDLRGSWGHLGPMEFAVEVTNIEKACDYLQKKGIELLSPPQTIEVSSGQWKYAYIVEPDNLYVSLVEPRY